MNLHQSEIFNSSGCISIAFEPVLYLLIQMITEIEVQTRLCYISSTLYSFLQPKGAHYYETSNLNNLNKHKKVQTCLRLQKQVDILCDSDHLTPRIDTSEQNICKCEYQH